MANETKENFFNFLDEGRLIPEKPEETTFGEKFDAARDVTWFNRLYKDSDFNQDFEDEENFSLTEEDISNVTQTYNKAFTEDIVNSKSKAEFEFKKQRADNTMKSYEKMGSLGFSSVSAMLAAGVTDPALLPLWFVPYGGFGKNIAKNYTGLSRYAQYAKNGMLVGAAEGTVIGAADYAMRPDGELDDILLSTFIGGGVGGGIGAVQGRLMRDIDAKHFEHNNVELTPKGKKEFANHTPSAKESRTLDTIDTGTTQGTVKVPKEWFDDAHSRALNDFSNPSVYAKLDDESFKWHMENTWGIKGGSRAEMQKELEELFATKTVDELEEIVEDVINKGVVNRYLSDIDGTDKLSQKAAQIKLGAKGRIAKNRERLEGKGFESYRFAKLYQGLVNKTIDKVKYKIKPAAPLRKGVMADEKYVRSTTAVTDGDKTVYIAKDGDGWVLTDKYGNISNTAFLDSTISKIDVDPEASLDDVIRHVFNHKAKNADEARKLEAQKDLEEVFGAKADAQQKKDDLRDVQPVDPEDVPKLVTNIWDTLKMRKTLSAIARVGQSVNPRVRDLGFKMGLVSSGLRDSKGNLVNIDMNASRLHDMFYKKYMGRIAEAYSVLRPQLGQMTNKEANERLFLYLNGNNPDGMTEPLLEAAASIHKHMNDMFKEAQDAGVKGLDEKLFLENYMPRQFKPELIEIALQKGSSKDFEEAFYQMIVSKRPSQGKDGFDRLARKAAKAYWKAISNDQYRARLLNSHKGRKGNINEGVREADELKEVLQEIDPELTDEQIDALTLAFSGSDSNKTKTPNVHARRRMLIDDKITIKIPYKEGHPDFGESFDFRLTDLVERNTEKLLLQYTHRMSGATSLAKVGIDGDDSFATLLRQVVDSYPEGTSAENVIQPEIRALEYMYETIRGSYNVTEQMASTTQKGLRRIREFNFFRLMGQAGLAALLETSNVMVENGIVHGLRNSPRFLSIIKRAKAGNLENSLLREIEHATGVGTDLKSGHFIGRDEDIAEVSDVFQSNYTKTDEFMANVRRYTSIAGGLSPVTIFLSRLNALNFCDNFVTQLRKGKPIYSDVKMKQLNLTPENVKIIKEMIDRHATFSKRWSGGDKLETLNLAKWENKNAVEAFEYSLALDTTQNVQVTNMGSTNPFIRSELGKTAFQFWGFVLGSNEQQYARQMIRLQNGDLTPVPIFLGAAFIGSLMYTARTYMNLEGRSDREEMLEKAFEPATMSRAVLSYIGMGGIGTYPLGYNGLDPMGIIQNPTIQLFQKGYQSVDTIGKGIMGEEVTEQGLRGLGGMIMSNHPLMRIPTNALAAELGE